MEEYGVSIGDLRETVMYWHIRVGEGVVSPKFINPGINLPIKELGSHQGIKEIYFLFVIT